MNNQGGDKKVLIIVVVVIVLLVACSVCGVTGWYLYRNSSSYMNSGTSSVDPTSTPTSTSTPTVSPTPTPDPNKPDKAFVDSSQAYNGTNLKLLYPKTWITKTSTVTGVDLIVYENPAKSTDTVDQGISVLHESLVGSGVYDANSYYDISYQKLLPSIPASAFTQSKTKITVGGLDAYTHTLTQKSSEGIPVTVRQVMTVKDRVAYVFTCSTVTTSYATKGSICDNVFKSVEFK